MAKSILIYSYYSNMPGVCQAEWIDDRMFAFVKKGYDISLISSTACFPHKTNAIENIRVPALSPYGAKLEYDRICRDKVPVKKLVFIYIKCMAALSPLLEKIKLKSGEGRWTWLLPAFAAGFFLKSVRNKEFIFTTGGPPSAHLAGILMAKIFGKKIICEFQDPLSGKDIGRNKLSQKGLGFFEKMILRFADVTIYCTRNAMLFARDQYPSFAHKIHYVYPGSHKISNPVEEKNLVNTKINITYLGSLYQTRNMDAMMQAIEELATQNESIVNALEINLFGNMNQDIKERILAFPYPCIHIRGFINRDSAIQKALDADVLLLIQNTDDRSITTIPFKTYDYLHTGKLVLGLIYKNDELEEMLIRYGHIVCQANDIEAIKNNLLKLLADPSKHFERIKPSNLTPDLAVSEMLNLIERTPFTKNSTD